MVLDSSAHSFSPVMKQELRKKKIVFGSVAIYLVTDLGKERKKIEEKVANSLCSVQKQVIYSFSADLISRKCNVLPRAYKSCTVMSFAITVTHGSHRAEGQRVTSAHNHLYILTWFLSMSCSWISETVKGRWSHYDYLVWFAARYIKCHLIIPASSLVHLGTFWRKKRSLHCVHKGIRNDRGSLHLLGSCSNGYWHLCYQSWVGSGFLLCLLQGDQPLNDLVYPYWSHFMLFLVYSSLGQIQCAQRQNDTRGDMIGKQSLSSGWSTPFVIIFKSNTLKDQEKVKWSFSQISYPVLRIVQFTLDIWAWYSLT